MLKKIIVIDAKPRERLVRYVHL